RRPRLRRRGEADEGPAAEEVTCVAATRVRGGERGRPDPGTSRSPPETLRVAAKRDSPFLGFHMTRYIAAFALTLTLTPTLTGGAEPNVVMIIGDDQAWGDYGFMGHPHIKTPHLDRLAAEGLVFKRGYVPSSLCRPSLATMITGLYPHQHRITCNDPPLPKGMTNAQANKDPGFLKQRQEMIAYIEKV